MSSEYINRSKNGQFISKYNIPLKNDIYKFYITENKSRKELSIIFNVPEYIVKKWLKYYNIYKDNNLIAKSLKIHHKQYNINKLPIDKIKEEYNNYKLSKHNICTKYHISPQILNKIILVTRKRKACNIKVKPIKDIIYNDYIIQNLSLNELSKKYNISKTSIIILLKRYNIKKSRKLAYIKSCKTMYEKYGQLYCQTKQGINKICKSKEMNNTSTKNPEILKKIYNTRRKNNTLFSSNKERIWLNLLNVNNRQIYIKGIKKSHLVDGFKDNIIYEFLGDYWHGNPKILKEKMNNDIQKERFIKTENNLKDLYDNGYKIIYCWENDFNKNNKHYQIFNGELKY